METQIEGIVIQGPAQNNDVHTLRTADNILYSCYTHRQEQAIYAPLNLEYLVGHRIQVRGTAHGHDLYEAVITQIYRDQNQ